MCANHSGVAVFNSGQPNKIRKSAWAKAIYPEKNLTVPIFHRLLLIVLSSGVITNVAVIYILDLPIFTQNYGKATTNQVYTVTFKPKFKRYMM